MPVIIITAHGSIPDAVAAMKLGAIDFLSKPLTPDALRKVVADVLDAQAPRPRPRAGRGEPAPSPRRSPPTSGTPSGDQPPRISTRPRSTSARPSPSTPKSAEAHNLMGVLHESRREHDASYRSYRAALKADRYYEPARRNMRRYYERFTFGQSRRPSTDRRGR